MRVLTYTSLFPNKMDPAHGIFIQQRMAHYARRPGASVEVVAPVPYVPSWARAAKGAMVASVPRQEQIANLTVHHPRYVLIPKISMPLHGWLMYRGSYGLVEKLHAARPFDCIDAHYVYPDGLAAVLIGRRLGIPVVVSARGTDMNLFPNFRLIRPMIEWTLHHVAGGIGVCTPLVNAMLEHGLPRECAAVIGNGVDLGRFQPVEPASARQKLGIPQDAKVLVGVGGLIPRKAFDLQIQAVAQIRPQHPTVKLYVVGKGPELANLQALVRKLRLEEAVFLVGEQPNESLRSWYSAADASCLTSSREGWPNVLLESMACGTPPVATRVWGTPEVITAPSLGVMVDQTVPSIAEGLDTALRTSWDRGAIVRYARQRTWDDVAAEVDACLWRWTGRKSEARLAASLQ